jgi:hypothetical protein
VFVSIHLAEVDEEVLRRRVETERMIAETTTDLVKLRGELTDEERARLEREQSGEADGLSPRQEEVLDVLRTNDRGARPPADHPRTRRRARRRSSAVHGSLLRLRALGRVTWEEGRARTLRVVDDDESGRIAG